MKKEKKLSASSILESRIGSILVDLLSRPLIVAYMSFTLQLVHFSEKIFNLRVRNEFIDMVFLSHEIEFV